MKKLPIGIQNFREIIEGDYVYIDKTRYIYMLVNSAKYYFLSRTRRFGKSLLLDTIGEVFCGDKELFSGLWIYDSDYAFEKYPTIRLDISRIASESCDILKHSILSYLKLCYEAEGFEHGDDIASDAFAKLIMLLYQKYNQKVVVLIDEYDKPILDHMDDIKTAEANRKVLRGFYGILKSMDPYLRFTFFTGISKFTKTSFFSELNNLKDITLSEDYAGICGIPIESLDHYFGEHIESLKAHKRFQNFGSVQERILAWYDGYSWDGETKLLNPFSLLNFFDQKRFSGFWYATGTPKFLLASIKKDPESFTNLKNAEITEYMLDSVDIDKIMIGSLLFQTGYLTIKEIPPTPYAPVYLLGIPNFEVRDAFNHHVLSALTEKDDEYAGRAKMEIGRLLQAGDLRRMLDVLRGLFASIPYNLHIDQEAYYHSIFYAMMTLLGFDMDVEVSTSKGRIDAVLELDDKVYVMEFKFERCPPKANAEKKKKLFDKILDEAMAQIKDRGYHKKYIGSGKTIYQAAFAFLGRDEIEMKTEIL